MTEPTNPASGQEPVAQPTFDVLPLSAEVRRALDKMGYTHPTPVQRAVFESAAEGRSLVVQARTGTGKTAAFGLPLVDRLVRPAAKVVQALVLCPTRELALQVSREVEQLGQFKDIHLVAIYGGASMSKQVDALKAGAQIVAGTPGRVLDHLRQGTLDPSQIKVLILDEADEMLSMGFARELNAILEMLPKSRQGLFFSATIPPDIERLANNNLKNAEIVTLSSDQVGALQISHFVYVMRDGDKIGQLVRILEVEDPESAVIFCNTRDETQRAAEALKNRGFDADWLNGDLPQPDRERVMTATKQGRLRFLVATDVAARGIDISHLTHVINLDFPDSAEQYVHRTGRTGRAGRTGTAISLIGPKDIGNLYLLRLTYKIRPIEKQLPSAGEMKTRAEMDVVQLFIDAFAGRAIHPDDLALARRVLTHDSAERIVAGLLRDHLGARGGDVATEAAEARRSRNPPPEPAPQHAPEPERPRPPARKHTTTPRIAPEPAPAPARATALAPASATATATAPSPEPRRTRGARAPRTTPADLPDLPGVTISDAAPSDPSDAFARGAGESSSDPGAGDGDFLQLFINVGRREGLHPRDLQKLLTDKGLGEVSPAGIRVRDRAAFVRVRKDLFDRAVAALSGEVIGGRTVVAELARER
jgi:ATP-dependent RNA helicase DeaD